jgi:hypothetical protein
MQTYEDCAIVMNVQPNHCPAHRDRSVARRCMLSTRIVAAHIGDCHSNAWRIGVCTRAKCAAAIAKAAVDSCQTSWRPSMVPSPSPTTTTTRSGSCRIARQLSQSSTDCNRHQQQIELQRLIDIRESVHGMQQYAQTPTSCIALVVLDYCHSYKTVALAQLQLVLLVWAQQLVLPSPNPSFHNRHQGMVHHHHRRRHRHRMLSNPRFSWVLTRL